MFKKKTLTIIYLVATLFITACGSSEMVTISPEEYEQLQKGMSYEEVTKIVGGHGEKNEISDTIAEYYYPGGNGLETDSKVTLMFIDGKLDFIGEYGLISSKEPVEVPSENTTEETRNVYLQEVKPWYDSLLKEYDNSWEDLWQKTWDGIEDGSVDIEQAKTRFNELRDEKLNGLSKAIQEFKTPNRLSEYKDEIENFKEKMLLAIDCRASAVTEALLAVEGTIDLDTDIIKETISRGDTYMLEALANMTTLEHDLNIPN